MKVLAAFGFALATAAMAASMPTSLMYHSSSVNGSAEDYNLTSPIFTTSVGILDTSSRTDNETMTTESETASTGDTNSTTLNTPENDFECIASTPHPLLPRFSFKFKGYCEEEWGRCFLRALRDHGTIADNWQCWQLDDGWWQVDYTHVHFYGVARAVYNLALADVVGFETDCS